MLQLISRSFSLDMKGGNHKTSMLSRDCLPERSLEKLATDAGLNLESAVKCNNAVISREGSVEQIATHMRSVVKTTLARPSEVGRAGAQIGG
jgi:hypothetical protein